MKGRTFSREYSATTSYMRSNGDITAVVHIVYDEKAVKKVEATYHGGDGSTKVETFDKLSAALIWVGQRLEEAGQ